MKRKSRDQKKIDAASEARGSRRNISRRAIRAAVRVFGKNAAWKAGIGAIGGRAPGWLVARSDRKDVVAERRARAEARRGA